MDMYIDYASGKLDLPVLSAQAHEQVCDTMVKTKAECTIVGR